jgi:transketolase
MNDQAAVIRGRAKAIRRHILRMAAAGRTSHVGSSLCCADILAVLYFDSLRIDPSDWDSPSCDRFVLSKGHAAMAWYAVLAEAGFFSKDLLGTYAFNGGLLSEHPCHSLPGIKVSTGSLGHGLPIAAGIALAQKMDRRKARTFVLISDGECNEGSVWESAMWCGHRKLDNLIVIVDDNHMQALGPSRQISGLDPLGEKWKAFGWGVLEADGHDHASLIKVITQATGEQGRPQAIIARTVLGKGVSFMENDLLWHYQVPSACQLQEALAQLEESA